MATESNEIEFVTHSGKQDDAIFSDKNITIVATGVQWGKTLGGAMWLKRKIHLNETKKAHFLITAPTYKILKQSTLPHFKKVMDGYGQYHEGDAVFKMHSGEMIFCRTATDPDSIVGIPDVEGIWGDEAGLYSQYFWENIQGRQSTKNCPIMLTTSPYTLNWIYKDFIKPKLAGKSFPNLTLIQAASWENPFNSLHNEEIREEKRRTMDPRRFQMLFGGEWQRMQGLVYSCFDEDINVVEPFTLPVGTRYFGGIDWGYTDPFSFVIYAITPDNMEYLISDFSKPGLTFPKQMELVHRAMKTFPIEKIYCGTDEPGSIEEFCRNKIPADQADTSKGSIRRGVDTVFELLSSRKLKFFKGQCENAIIELGTYHYPAPDELGPDDDSKEQNPVGADDHTLDALRYVVRGTRHLIKKEKIRMPQSTNPFDDIFKKKRRGGAEKWS